MHFLWVGKDSNLHSQMTTVLQTADFTHLPSDPCIGQNVLYNVLKAEVEGFEPSDRFYPATGLANRYDKPGSDILPNAYYNSDFDGKTLILFY